MSLGINQMLMEICDDLFPGIYLVAPPLSLS